MMMIIGMCFGIVFFTTSVQGQCPKNAVYKKGPDPCAPTCEQPNGVQPCRRPLFNKQYGCECLPGYVKKTNGACVKNTNWNCGRRCDGNEVWVNDKCVQSACKQQHCAGQQRKCGWGNPCTNGGCVCKPGFLRNSNDDCVRERSNRCASPGK